ncbi:P-loop domain-containing protein [Actinomyces sp.]|uniref:P-loop domain-containing protein n=1 Tax=Actinomyces sp. TaxID=29317 RepID=UPI0026DC1E60|nr:P-loop domain-containing protein [Actinomyces sp.]MDO4900651.1 ABC-ATPase domain-containing protein [Actinomyces sp.]
MTERSDYADGRGYGDRGNRRDRYDRGNGRGYDRGGYRDDRGRGYDRDRGNRGGRSYDRDRDFGDRRGGYDRGNRGYGDRSYRDNREDRGYGDRRGGYERGNRGYERDNRGYGDRRDGDRGYGRDRGYDRDRRDHGYDRNGRGRDYRREGRRHEKGPREGTLADLVDYLHVLDNRPYGAYRDTIGRYRAPEGWMLHVDYVQPDPYAPPTRIRIQAPADLPGLKLLQDAELTSTRDRRIAVGDFLTRELHQGFRGTNLSIASPGQEILERCSVIVSAPSDGDQDEAVGSPTDTADDKDSRTSDQQDGAVVDLFTALTETDEDAAADADAEGAPHGDTEPDATAAVTAPPADEGTAPGQAEDTAADAFAAAIGSTRPADLSEDSESEAEPAAESASSPASATLGAEAEDAALAADAEDAGAADVPTAASNIAARGEVDAPPAIVIEIRARVALPARGRSIRGREAANIFSHDLTREVNAALDLTGERATRLLEHVAALEDHRALTQAVVDNGWVSFLADDSILPRRSGVSDAPMEEGAIALTAPDSLAATVTLPHAGEVRGTAIGSGVTLVVGGGYHGKSTLLSAIERGVYPHIPGDGRELVATVPDAVKVRAADGRAVTGVDLTPFISHLPGDRDTVSFTTTNASGSTSQAASIVESIEAGTSALLLDEDTSATNLLIRDSRMRTLVADDQEPITPFVDRVGALAEAGVSTVLVMGGSGDYLDVADRVLLLDSYVLHDATEQAAEVAAAQPRETTALADFPMQSPRVPLPSQRTQRGPVRTRSRGTDSLTLDREDIDISDVAGVVESGQAEAVAYALRALLEQRFDGDSSLAQCLEDLDALLDDEGLDALDRRPAFLVRPRMVDVAAAVNRYRKLKLA